MTNEQMQAELDRLRSENEALRKGGQGGRLFLKVSPKGAVSLYGLNKQFPVSLYDGQWARLKEFMPTVDKFIVDNKAELERIKNLSPAEKQARVDAAEAARKAKTVAK